ncbi:Fe-S cluster assembly protein SufD [Candidatus Woesearchaeota archaeon]|nr:MAG: Fe-S cluster assembly protein SufD [Candidatus Woesearchaeota archaeon]
MNDYRKNALAKLATAKLPSFRYGLNIYIGTDFDFNIAPKKVAHDVIVDAEEQVNVFSGAEMPDAEEFFTDYWTEDHKLFYLHQAHANDFLMISIPENLILEKQITVKCIMKTSPLLSTILIKAGKNSTAKIVFSVEGGFSNSYYSQDVRIIAEQNSNIEMIGVQKLSKNAVMVQNKKAMAKKNATVNWTELSVGTRYMRSNAVTDLTGEGAQTQNTVLYLARASQRQDMYTASIHNAPHTHSNMLTKGAVYDEAKVLSRGLVKINDAAFGSNGFEKQDALLLSDKAEADAIPNLEIHNHDVKCTHGSTIGQIDYEKIFYLMSRGLSKKESEQKIIEGYFNPVLSLLDETLQETIRSSL